MPRKPTSEAANELLTLANAIERFTPNCRASSRHGWSEPNLATAVFQGSKRDPGRTRELRKIYLKEFPSRIL